MTENNKIRQEMTEGILQPGEEESGHMFATQRQGEIARLVEEKGAVKIGELMALFSVSVWQPYEFGRAPG